MREASWAEAVKARRSLGLVGAKAQLLSGTADCRWPSRPVCSAWRNADQSQ